MTTQLSASHVFSPRMHFVHPNKLKGWEFAKETSQISCLARALDMKYVIKSTRLKTNFSMCLGIDPGTTGNRFLSLIPVIVTIAAATLFIPHFGIGLFAGAVMSAVSNSVALIILTLRPERKTESDREYCEKFSNDPYSSAITVPILEELVFREFLIPSISKIALRYIASATSPFLGISLTVGTVSAIGGSSLLFGAVHMSNPHSRACVQALFATVSGICLGILYCSYGLGASIGAHIMNNTICVIIIQLS